MTARHHWWQRGIIHQVYPRSFMDSDGCDESIGAEIALRADEGVIVTLPDISPL